MGQGFPMKQGVLTNGRVRLLLNKGHAEIPGLTDNTIPRRLGPKRGSKIRKLFNLSKEGEKAQHKAPKVQRLITPGVLQKKRHKVALKRRRSEKNRLAAAEYSKILAQRQKEAKEAKELKRRRSASLRESRKSTSSQ